MQTPDVLPVRDLPALVLHFPSQRAIGVRALSGLSHRARDLRSLNRLAKRIAKNDDLAIHLRIIGLGTSEPHEFNSRSYDFWLTDKNRLYVAPSADFGIVPVRWFAEAFAYQLG